MSGFLNITEYSNKGDVSSETPKEPASKFQRIAIGTVSDAIHPDTHVVALFASFPCKVVFFAAENWRDGDPIPPGGFPIAESYEITRVLPMNTVMRVAALPEDAIT